ncbi:hypothetical protein Ddye_002098 [Dipteronia dyeriana]|uniref:Reverse transcriptase domain-containing protein n=1 Tax=Dipteronia dyeriana TaxID=168575 RepID=A0AAD9XPS9_9ROSI|nr:hypothetical protein Ddye_002098 [Dipteronia dyeriana]
MRCMFLIYRFADDTILFLEPKVKHLINSKRILWCFEMVLSLKINFHKSCVVRVGKKRLREDDWETVFKCKEAKPPISYLGMLLGVRPNSKYFWNPVLAHIQKLLTHQKKMFLSKWGRLVLIKLVLSSIPTGGKDGGYGLLEKWVWRYDREDKPLWKRVISSKYGVKVDNLIWKWEARVTASHFVKVVNGLFVEGFISAKILDRHFCVVVGCRNKSAPLKDVLKISTRAVFQSSTRFRVAWWFKNHYRGSKEPNTVMVENLEFCCLEDQLLKIRKSKKWIPHSNEALKFNVDGSVLVELGRARIRGVLHDSKGVVLCSFSTIVGNVDASRLS